MTDAPITKTEREELARGVWPAGWGTEDLRKRYEAALTAYEARIAELENALEPFAKFAQIGDDGVLGRPGLTADAKDEYVWLRPSPEMFPITMKHFRRARALSTTGDTGHDG